MDSPKVILLMGASGGVGQKMAVDLAAAGFDLALHYHNEPVDALLELVASKGVRCGQFKADITDETAVQNLVKAVEDQFGSIDVLVNNAGVSSNGMSWKYDLTDWEQTLAVNLTGPFLTIKHVLPGMRSRKFGRIINVSSIVAQSGFPGTVAYAASKSGLFGLTKTIAKEVIRKGITVNCLALGYFEAGMLYTIPEEMREEIREGIPAKTFGDTNAISECITYLSSDKAGYLTGQVLSINGGLN